MSRHTAPLLASALVLVGAVVQVSLYADSYTQATQATLDDMTSQTVATVPADRTRTTVGLGEQVTCSIDSSSWADTDCNTTPDPNVVEDDTIGDRVWSASGKCDVSPTTAGAHDSATMTAHHTPGAATVQVIVHDSEAKYDDTVTKTKGFSVIAPNAVNVAFHQDVSPWGTGTPKTWIGAKQQFRWTFGPSSVNFDQANLRINWTGNTWNWPDGTQSSFPAQKNPVSVGVVGGTHNRLTWESSDHYQIERLDNNGYQDHTTALTASIEYRNQASTWTHIVALQSIRNYRGADQKCRIRHEASDSSNGTYVGPWSN
jgi:hypothetical protein